jgi:hypothetical protein
MSSDEIIKLVQDNGLTLHGDIEHFAKLVRDDYSYTHASLWLTRIKGAVLAEREACAKVCDDIDAEYGGEDVLATWCAKAIRARSNT